MDPEEAPIAAASTAKSNKTEAAPKSKQTHRKRNICIGIFASIIAIVLLIVILALTVFKAKDPNLTLNSISVSDLSVALVMSRLSANLNLSLDVNMGIKNPNKVSFNLKNGSAEINYRGGLVGVVPVPERKLPADKTTAVNLTVTLFADRLLSNSHLFSDVAAAGSLPMSSKARVSGKVNILGIKIRVSANSACDFVVFVGNRTVSDRDCKTKTKL